MNEIVNRVAKSRLVSIDLEEFIDSNEKIIFDLKDVLFRGTILKEKEFRDFIKTNDWSGYQDKNVGLICSVDAIVPTWAYMLLVTKIKVFANTICFGDEDEVEKMLINQAVDKCLASQDLKDQKVVVKGCGNIRNVEYAYTLIADRLYPLVGSLMYGEPCSVVPIFKRKK